MLYRWLGRFLFIALYFYWRYVMKGSRRAYIAFVDSDNRLLLVKNWLGNGRWHLPGGGLKKGESFSSAAIREIKEELGVVIGRSSLRRLSRGSFRGCNYVVYLCRLNKRPILKTNRWELVASSWLNSDKNLRLEPPANQAAQHLYH